MKDAVSVRELQKNYGSAVVLKGLNLHVYKGEIFGILGGNGAGKTTALECLEGLRAYSGGSVEINGKTGIQLQASALPAYIKPLEAVRFFAKWKHAKEDDAVLSALGIRRLKRRYGELSTGQKRRLHLALALLGEPDILFLDEPTAGLDAEGRRSLHLRIRKLKEQGKTILLASHDMAEIEALCDRIAILSKGRVAFTGTVDELSAKAGGRYTIRVLTDTGERLHTAERIGDELLSLLESYKARGIPILDIKISHGTLEEHFIHIAEEE